MRAKLLLVDDTYANLVALTGVLEPLGQELVTARSGEEALRRLLDADFAVILLDVHMPGMDGFQTATMIRKRDRCRHTPIIFLTAHQGEPRHVFEGYAHGAVDYLVKPYDPDVLRTKVRVLVELHLSRERVRRDAESARRRERLDLERSGAARLQTWIDAVPHPMWIARADGSIEMVNASYRAKIGGELDDARMRSWTHAVRRDERDEAERRWTSGVRGAERFELRHRWSLRDGASVVHLATCVPELDDTSTPLRWICTATEIAGSRAEPQQAISDAEAALRTAETLPSLQVVREHDAR